MRTFCLLAYLAASALAQNAAPPAFEVASVKINPQSDGRMAIETPGNTLTMRSVTLRVALAWAYDIQRPQIVGPDWIDTVRYEIVAKAPEPVDADVMRVMLRPVLAERFHVIFHRETRQVQVMALTLPKEGHKMTPSKAVKADLKRDPVRGPVVEGARLSELCEDMSHDVKMPVVDLTGLTGRFDFPFNIEKYVNALRSQVMADPNNRPNEDELRLVLMRDAMAGELGLRVDSRKMAIELFVIDRVEQKPVDN